jgi:hypothetical protein
VTFAVSESGCGVGIRVVGGTIRLSDPPVEHVDIHVQPVCGEPQMGKFFESRAKEL